MNVSNKHMIDITNVDKMMPLLINQFAIITEVRKFKIVIIIVQFPYLTDH
jgi:hypothetical protein